MIIFRLTQLPQLTFFAYFLAEYSVLTVTAVFSRGEFARLRRILLVNVSRIKLNPITLNQGTKRALVRGDMRVVSLAKNMLAAPESTPGANFGRVVKGEHALCTTGALGTVSPSKIRI